jgi:hypothetical protein
VVRDKGIESCDERPDPLRTIMLPEALRIWELSRMGLAAWACAGSIGYVLCMCTRTSTLTHKHTLHIHPLTHKHTLHIHPLT